MRRIALLAAVLFCITALASCGGGGSAGAAPDTWDQASWDQATWQ